MLFPWRDDLPELISAGSGLDRERVISLLPAFWHGIKSRDVPALRTAYMDAVTKAVREKHYPWESMDGFSKSLCANRVFHM